MVRIVKNFVESFNRGFANQHEYLKSEKFSEDFKRVSLKTLKVSLSVIASLAIFVGGACAVVAITASIPAALPFQAVLVSALVAGIWKDIGGPIDIARKTYNFLSGFESLNTDGKKKDENFVITKDAMKHMLKSLQGIKWSKGARSNRNKKSPGLYLRPLTVRSTGIVSAPSLASGEGLSSVVSKRSSSTEFVSERG
jgi:hypothetical protein